MTLSSLLSLVQDLFSVSDRFGLREYPSAQDKHHT